jgi:hypothetical protein
MLCSILNQRSSYLYFLGFISGLAHGAPDTRRRRQSVEVGLLSEFCAGLQLEGSTLSALCSVGGGFNKPSLDLNQCLFNDDGSLTFA